MTDDLARLIADAYTRRADSVEQMRRPSANTPFQPEPMRRERRTQRPYADPTGETAIGNTKRKR